MKFHLIENRTLNVILSLSLSLSTYGSFAFLRIVAITSINLRYILIFYYVILIELDHIDVVLLIYLSNYANIKPIPFILKHFVISIII